MPHCLQACCLQSRASWLSHLENTRRTLLRKCCHALHRDNALPRSLISCPSMIWTTEWQPRRHLLLHSIHICHAEAHASSRCRVNQQSISLAPDCPALRTSCQVCRANPHRRDSTSLRPRSMLCPAAARRFTTPLQCSKANPTRRMDSIVTT